MPLSPKLQFKLNRLRNRYEEWKAGLRQTKQAVMAEQKMCPNCRALVARGDSKCPYCGQKLRVFAASPAGKVLGRLAPTGIPATGFIILANLLMFVVEYAASGGIAQNLSSGPTGAATLRLGESLPINFILSSHQYWRWVTACFLHGGFLHIGFNMWALYDLGPAVEHFYGRAKFLTFYMVTGVAGYIASGYFSQGDSLGASGAIFGLLGALIAYGTRRSHSAGGKEIRSMAMRWAVYALILTFVIPGVDEAAHLGGLACGFLIGMVIEDDPPVTDTQIRLWNAIAGIVIAVTLLAFYLMITAPPLLG